MKTAIRWTALFLVPVVLLLVLGPAAHALTMDLAHGSVAGLALYGAGMARSYDLFAQASGVGLAGKTTTIDLDTSRHSRYLAITVSFTETISVAVATAVRNLGSAFAIFDRIRISESGVDTGVGDARLFQFASDFLKGQVGSRVRQTSVAIGATNVIERMIIPFERIAQAIGSETRYRVRNPGNRFQLNFDVNLTPDQRILTPGGATLAMTNIVIQVRQYTADANDAQLPLWAPRWREQIVQVPAASTALRHELDIGSDYIRGITIAQETTTTGLVTDALSGVQLRDDKRIFVGETGLVPWAELAADQEFLSNGDVFASNGGSQLHLDFQDRGRLSHVISPAEIAGRLRLIFNAAPSAQAGATQIRTLLHVLTRDVPGVIPGRKVISPTIPFPV